MPRWRIAATLSSAWPVVSSTVGAADLGGTLRDCGVSVDALPELAELAAQQWTGTFNPRPFDAAGALDLPSGLLAAAIAKKT